MRSDLPRDFKIQRSTAPEGKLFSIQVSRVLTISALWDLHLLTNFPFCHKVS